MGLTTMNNDRTILITGKQGTGKSTKAKTFVNNPVVLYANDIDFDVGSFPVEQGIIIEDVHYKPDKSAILDIIRRYNNKDPVRGIGEDYGAQRTNPDLHERNIKEIDNLIDSLKNIQATK